MRGGGWKEFFVNKNMRTTYGVVFGSVRRTQWIPVVGSGIVQVCDALCCSIDDIALLYS